VSVHDDRLHAEVDRQLAEIRAACDGLATRSGLLIAAAAAVAAILAPNIHVGHHEVLLVLALIAFGVATLTAIATLMPWLKIGPLATSLASWAGGRPSATTSSLLYDSKIVILMADLNRLLAMRIFFAIQDITTVISVALALGYTAWK
jgi:hypothetical protein